MFETGTSANGFSATIQESTHSLLTALAGQPQDESEKPHKLHGSWRLVAQTRINRLRTIAALIDEHGRYRSNPALEKAKDILEASEDIITHSKENIRARWTGALRDMTWRQIHMAEAYIVSMLPEMERQHRMDEVLYDARSILDRDDPVMVAAASSGWRKVSPATNSNVQSPSAGTVAGTRDAEKQEADSRVFAYELVRRYREAWDDRYTASRGFRNRLIVLIAIVLFAVAILVVSGSLGMVWLNLVPEQPHAFLEPHLNDFLAMITIVVLGGIGGLISGAGEVVRVGGNYNPFSLPWYMLFYKIPMGMLTGLLGVLAIKGNLLPDIHLTMNNWSQIVIWALVFGASQQLITFMVDRRVRAFSTSTPQEQAVNR